MIARLTHLLRSFLKNEAGPTSVEYAVMLALVISVCIASVTAVGADSKQTYKEVRKVLKLKKH